LIDILWTRECLERYAASARHQDFVPCDDEDDKGGEYNDDDKSNQKINILTVLSMTYSLTSDADPGEMGFDSNLIIPLTWLLCVYQAKDHKDTQQVTISNDAQNNTFLRIVGHTTRGSNEIELDSSNHPELSMDSLMLIEIDKSNA